MNSTTLVHKTQQLKKQLKKTTLKSYNRTVFEIDRTWQLRTGTKETKATSGIWKEKYSLLHKNTELKIYLKNNSTQSKKSVPKDIFKKDIFDLVAETCKS